MTTGRINQVTIFEPARPRRAEAYRRREPGGRVVYYGRRSPRDVTSAPTVPGARLRQVPQGHLFAPTMFPKGRSAIPPSTARVPRRLYRI
jgi:hypothetical protein